MGAGEDVKFRCVHVVPNPKVSVSYVYNMVMRINPVLQKTECLTLGYCKSHGGGIRCKETGCPRSAQQQGYCRRHISLIEYLHLTSYEDSETYMQEHDVETSNDSVLRCLLAQEQMRNKKHLPGSRTMKHAIHRVDTSTNIVDEDEDTLDSSTTLFSLKKTRNPPERAISEKDMEVCMLLQQLKKKS